jgi:hypothetical protein
LVVGAARVEDDEVEAAEMIGGPALAAAADLGVEAVDQVDDVEEAAAGAAANAGAGDAHGEMRLTGARTANQHDVALLGEEATAGEVTHQGHVNRGVGEHELVDLLGEGQLGDGDLVLHRARLLLTDLGGE